MHGAGQAGQAALHIRQGLPKGVEVLCESPQSFQIRLETLFAPRCGFQLLRLCLRGPFAFREAKFKFLNPSLLFLGLPVSE
jgi:hypothetical protein